MTRRRWIADEFSGDRASLTGDHADHLIRVLRARAGQEFDIVAGPQVRRGRIVSITPERVEFELDEEIPAAQTLNLTLLLSIIKFDRMEWAIEKCTELGVSQIIPLIAQRTDTHLAAASAKRLDRWRKIALQASEQSRRTAPPDISEAVRLAQAVKTAGLRVVLAESEKLQSLSAILPEGAEGITVAVGPEGGWTDAELKAFHDNGWISASLGQTILRAETAAIAAAAIIGSSQS